MPKKAPTQVTVIYIGVIRNRDFYQYSLMAKSKAKKTLETQQLSDLFRRMAVAVFSTTTGLTVKDSTELRSQLRKAGVDHVLAKKTLIRRALSEVGMTNIDLAPISGSFAMSFGYEDEVLPAQLLAKFAKTHESLKFLGGVINGTMVDAAQVIHLSKLPGREQLRAHLARTVAVPLSGLVSVLSGNMRGLVRILQAYNEKKSIASHTP